MASIRRFNKAVKTAVAKGATKMRPAVGPTSTKFMRGTNKTSQAQAVKNGILY